MDEFSAIVLAPGATLPNAERRGVVRITTDDEQILINFGGQSVSPSSDTWLRTYGVADVVLGESLRVWLTPDLNAAPPHATSPVRHIERVHSPQHRA